MRFTSEIQTYKWDHEEHYLLMNLN